MGATGLSSFVRLLTPFTNQAGAEVAWQNGAPRVVGRETPLENSFLVTLYVTSNDSFHRNGLMETLTLFACSQICDGSLFCSELLSLGL